MAGIGLKSFKYAVLNSDGETYDTVKTLAGAIECQVSLDLSEAILYADDAVKEQVTEFKTGTLTLGIDDDDDTVFAELLGKTVDGDTGLVASNVDDVPIFVGFGHVVPKMVGGTKYYKVEFFSKVKFKPFLADAKTKGESLEFTTPSVEATIFKNDDGDWEKHGVYASESAANAVLESLFVQSAVTLQITTQPQDTAVTEGSISELLTVAGSASSGTINYQWYESSSYINKSGAMINGANSATFAIPTTLETTDSPKYYYCALSHASAPSVISNVAKVTITA